MPKVSKVGKFRQTAAAAARNTTSKSHDSSSSNKAKKTPNNKEHDPTMELDKIHVPSAKSFSVVVVVVEKDATIDNNKVQKADTAQQHKTTEESLLSRGQRKRQAKRDQYLRKEKMILSSLKLQKEQDQKKRIDGLDALKEALLETVKEPPTKQGTASSTSTTQVIVVKSNKAKQRLASSELVHMSLVLQHPVFQSNPFEAVQAHLRNTLAPQGKQQEAATALKLQQEQQAAQQRKQAKKERLQDIKGNNKNKSNHNHNNSHKKKNTKSKFKATRSRSGKKR